jgi:hypothetical protein
MQQMVRSLPEINQHLEKRFLKGSSLLEPLTEASHSLVSDSESLLILALGKADGSQLLNETANLIALPLQYLTDWRTSIFSRLTELENSRVALDTLQQSEATLKEILAPLRHMETMFRVEAANLSVTLRDVFEGLTEDIATIQTKVQATFGEQFRRLAEARVILDNVITKVRQQVVSFEIQVTVKKAQIENSLTSLSREIQKNSEREIELSSASRKVASAIGDLIVTLQTHDIASQRLVHIQSGLERILGLLAGKNRPHRSSCSPALWDAFDLMRVQQAQLAAVSHQIEESETSAETALGRIRQSVASLDTDCLLLQEFKEVTVAADGSIQTLLEMLVDVRDLVAEGVYSCHSFSDSIAPVGSAVAALTGALQQLAHQMKLVALNAQVQAIKIGNGTGLEVLSAYTAQLSSSTSDLAITIAGKIAALVSAFASMTHFFEDIADAGEKQLAHLDGEGAVLRRKLHDLRDQTLTKLQSVGAILDEIESCTANLRQQTDFRVLIIRPLFTMAQRLEGISQRLRTYLPQTREAVSSVVDNSQYSMAEERKIHNAVTNGNGQTPKTTEEQSQTDSVAEFF